MGNPATTAGLIAVLAGRQRVLALGGYAVVSHGHARPTYDADVWLDPVLPLEKWGATLRELAAANALRFVEIGSWQEISPDELESAIERDGVIRLLGANQPLDIFRRPNELDVASFDEVWQRAALLEDGTRLPDAVDLLVTKQLTGRAKDQMDILFLEHKAETEGLALLATGSGGEICALLERFLTPNLAAAACRYADPGVSALARRYLGELATEGDPFAADLLRELESQGLA